MYKDLRTCASVVIKVGMVGDSQIGKTSLMVKYVEGSFDEDYIQTLGTSSLDHNPINPLIKRFRRQFYGEDYHSSSNDNNIFNMGSGRSTRIREHAASRVQ